ncbi:unnamed protein product [Ectocarpus sp. CCAP 1310/34]|nr:unnamed protein product [Ectocarpus sp. CCAP 1310/34]
MLINFLHYVLCVCQSQGWSSRYLLNSDPGRYSDHTGGGWRERLDSRPPAGCVWAEGDTGWELDKSYTRCDDEGW